MTRSCLLRWWCLLWGLIRTLRSIESNLATMRQHEHDKMSHTLRNLIEQSPGVAMAFAEGTAGPPGAE